MWLLSVPSFFTKHIYSEGTLILFAMYVCWAYPHMYIQYLDKGTLIYNMDVYWRCFHFKYNWLVLLVWNNHKQRVYTHRVNLDLWGSVPAYTMYCNRDAGTLVHIYSYTGDSILFINIWTPSTNICGFTEEGTITKCNFAFRECTLLTH